MAHTIGKADKKSAGDDGKEKIHFSVDIPRPLHRKAKIKAVIEGKSLREVVIEMLETYTKE